jgi:hypothetical protein
MPLLGPMGFLRISVIAIHSFAFKPEIKNKSPRKAGFSHADICCTKELEYIVYF